MQEEKEKVVQEWPVPRNADELSSFLGMVNYHREFIEQFARESSPLYGILQKKVSFQWGQQEEQHAFKTLKRALTTAPVLSYPNNTDPFLLDCDASNYAIGA